MHAFKDIKIYIKQCYLRQRGHGQREKQIDYWNIIYSSEIETDTPISTINMQSHEERIEDFKK